MGCFGKLISVFFKRNKNVIAHIYIDNISHVETIKLFAVNIGLQIRAEFISQPHISVMGTLKEINKLILHEYVVNYHIIDYDFS